MAEPTPPSQPAAAPTPTPAPAAAPKPAAPTGNPALRMMGLPNLPKKLPSRNWMIFWTICGTFSAAIIYDKREKNRATAKWRHAVAPLAKEPIGAANQLPRKLTIYIEAPPGDGLRSAQDHFIEYAKPVLASSGLDWEFVQGRQQGDVRAAVAEKIRRTRKRQERPGEEMPLTDENIVDDLRAKLKLPQYQGVNGDIVIGRHAWKEYMRGLHEGWLGPLDPPALPEPPAKPEPEVPATETAAATAADGEAKQPEEPKEEKKEEEKKDEKPKRPPQPIPYNSPDSYSEAALPNTIPAEFAPSAVLPFPHRLGFRHTFVRLGWFLNRRKLADDVGRQVAAVCFAASRDWRQDGDGEYEQSGVLAHEERDWVKSVWKDEEPTEEEKAAAAKEPPKPPKEMIWRSPMKLDSRVVQRMRRFELQPEDEEKAARIVVKEEEIEGWIKGSFRKLFRWGIDSWNKQPMKPNVGDLD
ncbi:mitochondrial import inner membrane translocase subunit tim54 [Lecanicillium sp. MT-2017a]|nr:mitochondrial import inner membrane translocase subunit tim54 [Lecanicillium sp. MT-2017a]